MKFIPIIILSIFLSGCGLFKKDGPTIEPAKVVKIDMDALIPCDLLKEVLVINTFEDGLKVYAETAEAYGKCAKQQSNSIKLLKQFGNIK